MLYIFDKDGTLVGGLGNRPANTPEEQIPLPGVVKKIASLRVARHTLAIASNQGGVAWGFLSKSQARDLVRDAARKVGGVDHWRCCCYDKRAATRNPDNPYARGSYRRKPAPGMLKELMQAAGASAANTIMIGDADSDRQAAEAAGVRFIWAADFFKQEKENAEER
jgi:D-glycero-D-manno-heptose 1,7-bisphosphate phosphatase